MEHNPITNQLATWALHDSQQYRRHRDNRDEAQLRHDKHSRDFWDAKMAKDESRMIRRAEQIEARLSRNG